MPSFIVSLLLGLSAAAVVMVGHTVGDPTAATLFYFVAGTIVGGRVTYILVKF